jgi:hypothetical protein
MLIHKNYARTLPNLPRNILRGSKVP